MKRIAILLALAALAAAPLAAGAVSRSTATFAFCTDPTFPPMESATTSGKIVGFDVDMAAKLAALWGRSSKAVKTDFGGLIPALNAKKCDVVISGMFVTPDRVKQAGAVPYMRSHRVLIAKAGNPKHITGPNSLKGLTVAVQAATKYEDYLKKLQKKIGFKLQSYPGDNDAVAQILLGRADAVLTQDTSYRSQSQAHPGKLALAYQFPTFDSFGIYYRKGDTTGALVKDGVSTLRSNGTLAKLAAKYKIPTDAVK
jgi:polar amino acid transport system substrate-binding protein